MGLDQVKIYPPGEDVLFHPKVYAFELEAEVEVYVGSSNLTGAGLSKNHECGIFIRAESTHSKLQQFLNYIDERFDEASVLDADFITAYKANKKRVKDAEDELKKFTRIAPARRAKNSFTTTHAQDLRWKEFVTKVKNDTVGAFDMRLDMLGRIHKWFASGRSFQEFTLGERKRVTGIIFPSKPKNIDWGLFGQMTANGGFYDVLDDHTNIISMALDKIPLYEPVKWSHYDDFWTCFSLIPQASDGWIGLATRLLAMKRPDEFVCLTRKNKQGVCGYLGAPYSTMTLKNYWERIIEKVRITPWYLKKEPRDPLERKIWHCRTALLDAIYYDQT
ncbi:phospholipase D-like domain-containing protein [Dyella monticola]|uniref:phospholipase D-like domain-containing protein n=1 Tax=Dyella monticola TaxID=1927958 RepID=UPI001314A6F7|nr:phospholipase D family protein [Dyella monticola]